MIFTRKAAGQQRNLKQENAMLRSALEVILSEIENSRTESAKNFARMALRGDRRNETVPEMRIARSQDVFSENNLRRNELLNASAEQLLAASL